jgi:hypothetical protein
VRTSTLTGQNSFIIRILRVLLVGLKKTVNKTVYFIQLLINYINNVGSSITKSLFYNYIFCFVGNPFLRCFRGRALYSSTASKLDRENSLHVYCDISLMLTYVKEQLCRLKSCVFWDITPCSPLQVNRRFRGTCHLHLRGSKLSQVRNQHEASRK